MHANLFFFFLFQSSQLLVGFYGSLSSDRMDGKSGVWTLSFFIRIPHLFRISVQVRETFLAFAIL